jgi:hypothetical protein
MRFQVVLLLLLLGVGLITLSGCVPGDGKHTAEKPAGFFWGVWHGWITPISLIWGIFNRSIRIYETANTGWWYDLGYYMAVISGFGGLSLVRRTKKSEQ